MDEVEGVVMIAGEAVRTDGSGALVLEGSICADCYKTVFPPVPICPECMSDAVSAQPLPTHGTLYSWSVVHVAPKGWTVPYTAGYVDLSEGVRVFTHIVDADPGDLEMDMDVALCVATLGAEDDGTPKASYAFAPVRKEA